MCADRSNGLRDGTVRRESIMLAKIAEALIREGTVICMFKGAIKKLFEYMDGLLEKVCNLPGLMNTLENYNEGLFSTVLRIMNGSVMVIANIILALFIMLELQRVALRVEGTGGTMGYEMPMKVMIKAAICKVVLDKSVEILAAIYNTTLYLIQGISEVATGGTIGFFDLAELNHAVDNNLSGLGNEILAMLITLIIFLIAAATCIAIEVLVVARFVELYIFIAISPIPIATLANDEHSAIAKNFLKHFTAVAFQGVLLMLVIALFPPLMNGAFNAINSGGDDFIWPLLKTAGMCCVLAMAVLSSQKWSKSIANAM